MDTSNVFNIPASNYEAFKQAIDKLNIRARKTGNPSIDHMLIGTVDNGPGKDVTLNVWVGCEDQFKISGYTFVGRLDHIGKQVIVASREEIDITRFPTSHCDHCNTTRERHSTYIIRDEEGNLRQVGGTCLRDFIGTNPEAILKGFENIRKLVTRFSKSNYIDNSIKHYTIDLRRFLAYCFRAVDHTGTFISKKAVQESSDENIMTTGTLAMIIEGSQNGTWTVSQKNFEDADEAIALATEEFANPENNFGQNIKQIIEWGFVPYRHTNTAAFIAGLLVRKREKEIREAARALAPEAKSEHFLSEGDVFEGEVVVTRTRFIEDTGTSVVTMQHGANILVTFSTGSFRPNVGDKITIKGRVRKNDEFRGVKQTNLTRVRVK